MSLLDGARLAAVDTETTGFDSTVGHVLEVAVVEIEGVRIGASWSTLVRPGRPIPADAVAIHGITDAMVSGAPDPAEAAIRLREACGDRPLVFHHAAFDLPFLARLLRKAGAPPLLSPVVDTLGLARGVVRSEAHSLAALAATLSLPPEPPHRALGDALTTARLFLVLAERWERELGIRTLAELAAASQDVLRISNAERSRAALASPFAPAERARSAQLPLL